MTTRTAYERFCDLFTSELRAQDWERAAYKTFAVAPNATDDEYMEALIAHTIERSAQQPMRGPIFPAGYVGPSRNPKVQRAHERHIRKMALTHGA
jgi:hypothetical protein